SRCTLFPYTTLFRSIVKSGELSQADVVVLDPPRAGATAPVVRGITESRPRKIVHVSCDVATFSRDVATYREMGWHMESLRVFDIDRKSTRLNSSHVS